MASDDFYLVLPSNASMTTHPNNTLAQYITNLPRRICLSGEWECGLTEIHYPHDWYNVRNARLTVEHGDKTETDAYFEDGYYDSAKTLVRALNDELKGGRVKFAYEPVTQKVTAYMKGDTTLALYGDLPDILAACSIRTREGYDDAAPETAPSHRAILVLHSVAANE